ncbi:MAG: ATP-dependent DNA helicase [Microbacterium sp. SCN 71-21]|uniref:ATP-dependent DNA helicase n=1 Tax=Microbacterium sp. SCN 71-21 TaxID=1660116 RepID=UPI00086D769B|nr:ATP-dependent DNA helicase [Microbacterium sp. SCN 71-21]ODU77881.1 MAG: ATP-dependent DNA helicase [Microbacterium sp. SCN 71-21]
MTVSAAAVAAALGQFPPTDEQARVIEAALGPALVVAGAGSGKTETMAGRVVWLVANRLVARHEVLGLTFTRKAAGELAERIERRLARLAEFEAAGLVDRLDELHAVGALDAFGELERAGAPAAERRARIADLAGRLGADAAAGAVDPDDLLDRPTVATYNSFADALVRDNAVLIGRDPDAQVLSESASWLLMRRVALDSDDSRLESRSESLGTIVSAALGLAGAAVDNLADLGDVAAFPSRFRGILERPSETARVSVYADFPRFVEKVDGLEVLAGLAAGYASAKERRGVIDFADQVAGALQIVERHRDVAEGLRSRFRVVLLDEYQDTSVVQARLLAALFADTAVMAVGDPHQAIYGWRGASAGNLDDFPRAFVTRGACERFSLLTSWRNSADVLEIASALLAPLAGGADVAALRPRPGAARGEVDLEMASTLDDEAERVAEWFVRVRAERRCVGLSTTGAVLFRSKRRMSVFAEALARHRVPHRVLGLGGLLDTPEVVDIVAALRVIADPLAGSELIRLLVGPRWAIGVADLRELRALGARLARHDAALQPLAPDVVATLRASAADDHGSLSDALEFFPRVRDDHGWLAGFTPAARTRLREAAGVIAAWRRAAGLPVLDLVRLIESELRLDLELAANEARGPQRTAHEQVRAFTAEIAGFLSSDDARSLPSLLAWLDHAASVDELAPRPEPTEPDVVQLLTIHGSKGLEWDAVAVVRMVEDELPAASRDAKGWLTFGALPFEFRGDAPWLPRLAWSAAEAPTQQALRDAVEAFGEQNRDRQVAEERRLAYVAVTRARDHLLLTGSSWAGTVQPRAASRFLREAASALGRGAVDVDPGERPDDVVRTVSWPLDALGSRRERVERAAELVRAADAVILDPDLSLLLVERDEQRRGGDRSAPTRIPASAYKDFTTDYSAAVAARSRPLPERPYRETRIGTSFHSWVERRAGLAGRAGLDDELWDGDEPGGVAEPAALAPLIDAFLASEWAPLQPIEVETEIDFRLDDLDGRPHVIVCKLDAVYRRGDRIEIVDWKTGAPPRTASERAERMVQLDLYRRAYHSRHGVPLDQIDVALFYVAHGLVLRG